jgi:hypothetical protein
MRIAFDLDDTLIPGEFPFPTEPAPQGLLARWFAQEPLRLGTVELLTELARQGHEVCIYTTSLRRCFAVKMLFRAYGIPIRRVINEDVHQRAVRRLGDVYTVCTKYPPAFGIDVLVDNSQIVHLEADAFAYSMILVRPDDADWVRTVRTRLELNGGR